VNVSDMRGPRPKSNGWICKSTPCGPQGVEARHLYSDQASGARKDRPRLPSVLAVPARRDTLVVWRLDRLARSLRQSD